MQLDVPQAEDVYQPQILEFDNSNQNSSVNQSFNANLKPPMTGKAGKGPNLSPQIL